jgi:anti-anti-sigma factor
MPSAPAPSPAPQEAGRVPRIEVSFEARPGEAVLRLAGEAGVRQAGELSAALLPLSACRPPCLTLDLSGLTFIACLAVGVLAGFRRGLARAGGRVCLAPALQGPVRAALERAGLLARFDPPQGAGDRGAGAAPPEPPPPHGEDAGKVVNHVPKVRHPGRASA